MADDELPDSARKLTKTAMAGYALLATMVAVMGTMGTVLTQAWTWHDERLELLLLKESTEQPLIVALGTHADRRAAAICAEQIEALGLDERLAELRGSVEKSLEKPPTIADISRRQRADGSRLIRLEALHEVGVARAIADRAREEAALRAGRHEP
jgi:hypothetical protein